MKYSDKLRDPRWQKKRLEVFERDCWACARCGDDSSTLSIHHLHYEPGRNPWDYENDKLITLCQTCHHEDYEYMPQAIATLNRAVKEAGFSPTDIEEIADGFSKMPMINPREVMASIIKFALTDAMMSIEKVFWSRNREAGNGSNAINKT